MENDEEKSKEIEKAGFATKAVHVGENVDTAYGAHSIPIYQTSTFTGTVEQLAARFAKKERGYKYTRLGNPTTNALEEKITALEDGEITGAFASGMAALDVSIKAALKAGDHLITDKTIYGGTDSLFRKHFPDYNIEVTFVDASNIDEIKKAIRPNTKIFFGESPANPTLKILDIQKIAELCHENKIAFVFDNTFATPYLQSPFKLGADVIVHSLTKYLNGHGFIVGGSATVSKEYKSNEEEKEKYIQKLESSLCDEGAILSPFNAWLVINGIYTLSIRMDKHCQNAGLVAEFLENHEKIETVYYPGLKSSPYYELAKKQMRGFGGMISFEVKGGVEAGAKFINNTKVCMTAVSLGTVHTLIQHPASMTHAIIPKEKRLEANITDGLVRISVGIENANDIIYDLEQALYKI